jgi:outer membrane lipoprotein carrier protein
MINFLFSGIKSFSTFSADFKQTIINKFNNSIKYEGEMRIKKPSFGLWIYKYPVTKRIFINRQNVVIDEPDLEQAIITKIDKNINFLKIFENAKLQKKNTYIANFNDKEYKIITDKKEIIKTISYKDELDNSVVIEFFNIKINRDIKNSIFIFAIPKSYDIIKE